MSAALRRSRSDGFCCNGCKTVYEILNHKGFGRFYDLRDRPLTPVYNEGHQKPAWLEALAAQLETSASTAHLSLSIQGMHCSGCVWLMDKAFEQYPGAIKIENNPTRGQLELWVSNDFPLLAWAKEVQSFGYALGPARSESTPSNRPLLLKLGICVALTSNVMLLAAANYFGLSAGPVYEWMRSASFLLATLALFVGGSVFFQPAWAALRHGVIHFDVPIVLGLWLSYAGSVYALARGKEVYFDSVVGFVTLMVAGRWIIEHVMDAQRRKTLHPGDLGALLIRKKQGDAISIEPSRTIRAGDELVLRPGEVCPIEVTLHDKNALFSKEWITGESAPLSVVATHRVPAGAILATESPVTVVAMEAFDASALNRLLSSPKSSPRERSAMSAWKPFAPWYFGFVIAAALGSLFNGWVIHGSMVQAWDSAAAALVVSCPCAFVIATPLAYELAIAKLREMGVWVRSAAFFERISKISAVAFDKTGTLTDACFQLKDIEKLEKLPRGEKEILHRLAIASVHPKSRALAHALRDLPLRTDVPMLVHEVAGAGVEGRVPGHIYRLGTPEFAGVTGTQADVVFALDGQPIETFDFEEQLRFEATQEVGALKALGLNTHILSGDQTEAVIQVAQRLGVASSHAEMKPSDKSAWIRGKKILFMGDGINDKPAMSEAWCSGTPAAAQPLVLHSADFFWTTPGLPPVTWMVQQARQLIRMRNGFYIFAAFYNAIAISAAWLGYLRPWMAAVLMPSSSLLLMGVAWLFSRRRTETPT